MHPAVFVLMIFLARFDLRASAIDPAVLAMLRDLSERGARKTDEMEVAAFIVRSADGHLSCLLWPHTDSVRSARFDGAIPNGTVALAHTHPLYAEKPSRGDIEQARRIGLPIYVVTRWHLYVVDPATGESVQLIRQRNWTRDDNRCSCSALHAAVSPAMSGGGSLDRR